MKHYQQLKAEQGLVKEETITTQSMASNLREIQSWTASNK
jgi:hypothetical protein